jgi:trigger factor
MPSTVENLGQLERRVTMAVPMVEIEKKVEERLKGLARTMKMPGFRPGKVPLKIVEQQYGPQVRGEVIRDAVQKAFSETVRDQKLRVAGMPNIEPKPGSSSGDLEFLATFEIYPEFTPADFAEVALDKPVLNVGDAEVDRTIEILRKQRVHYHEADRAAGDEDQVTIDFVGTVDGVEFQGGKSEGFAFVLGQGRMLQDFEIGIRGMKAGEEKTIPVQFPADYGSKEVAGKMASFKIKVHKVEHPHMPDLDADFARSLGVPSGDLETMRVEVKKNVEREVKKRLSARVKQQVMDKLLESNKLEVPKALVQMEQQQLAERAKQQMREQGMPVDGMPFEASLFAENAKRRVSLGLILAELVKRNDLSAKPEQVRALIEEHAQSYEQPSEVIRWFYSQPDRLAEFEGLVVEDNVIDWALKSAKVKEVSVAFDELMGNAA